MQQTAVIWEQRFKRETNFGGKIAKKQVLYGIYWGKRKYTSLTMTVLKEVKQLQCESKHCRYNKTGIYTIKKKTPLGKQCAKAAKYC